MRLDTSYLGFRLPHPFMAGASPLVDSLDMVRRLEDRGLVERFPCAEDGRATNAQLTDAGWDAVVDAAPEHVTTVRHLVVDALTPAQLNELGDIADALLSRLDPQGRMTAVPDPAAPIAEAR